LPSGNKNFILGAALAVGINTPQATNIKTPCVTSLLIADFIVIDVASPVEKLMISPPRRDVVCCAGHALGDDAYTKDFVAPALALAS
jgi:hypothetical protein